jgi:hypothetical protein
LILLKRAFFEMRLGFYGRGGFGEDEWPFS